MKLYTVNKNDANQRLDKFILKLMPSIPKSLVYKGLRKNNIRINGKHCHDGSTIIKENDNISLYFPDEFFNKSIAIPAKLPHPEIIYEDDNILILNKPSGIPAHGDDKGTSDTLIDRVKYYLFSKGSYNPESENTFAPALCNRLDRNTSGLVIAAKNAEALRIVNEKIKNREIEKLYICQCSGIPKKESDTITSYLKRGDKKVYVSDQAVGKKIITKYKIIRKEKKSCYLEINLLTGRTHQIRAHLASIGHPLVGDVKYGGIKNETGYFLESYKLHFNFKSDAGVLNYLKEKEFYSKRFLQ